MQSSQNETESAKGKKVLPLRGRMSLFVLHKKCTWEKSGEMRPHSRISRAVQIERQIFVVDEEN